MNTWCNYTDIEDKGNLPNSLALPILYSIKRLQKRDRLRLKWQCYSDELTGKQGFRAVAKRAHSTLELDQNYHLISILDNTGNFASVLPMRRAQWAVFVNSLILKRKGNISKHLTPGSSLQSTDHMESIPPIWEGTGVWLRGSCSVLAKETSCPSEAPHNRDKGGFALWEEEIPVILLCCYFHLCLEMTLIFMLA